MGVIYSAIERRNIRISSLLIHAVYGFDTVAGAALRSELCVSSFYMALNFGKARAVNCLQSHSVLKLFTGFAIAALKHCAAIKLKAMITISANTNK